MKIFSDNHVKCNVFLIDWIVGIINSILPNPLDKPEWSVKRYPIFIPHSEVPPLQITSRKQVSEIPCISLNEYFEQLVWIFIPRSEVLEFQLYEMKSAKQVSEIPYINLNKSFEELAWVFNMP